MDEEVRLFDLDVTLKAIVCEPHSTLATIQFARQHGENPAVDLTFHTRRQDILDTLIVGRKYQVTFKQYNDPIDDRE
jgi:hypothetical protein